MKIKGKSEDIQRAILTTLGLAGILALTLVAPNTIKLLRFLPGVKKARQSYYIKSAVSRLKEKGLVEFVTKNGKTFARLTPSGEERLNLYQLDQIKIKKPKRWDGRWHVVIFDIKEMKRRTRDQLRAQLVQFNFQRLQHSVWVSPYECEELIFMLKTSFSLGREVIYMKVEKIENDKWLRSIFQLG